jgi:hypothetical protein
MACHSSSHRYSSIYLEQKYMYMGGVLRRRRWWHLEGVSGRALVRDERVVWCVVWRGVDLICDWTGQSSGNGCCCLLLLLMMMAGVGFELPTSFSFVDLVWCSAVKLEEHSPGAHHVDHTPFPA